MLPLRQPLQLQPAGKLAGWLACLLASWRSQWLDVRAASRLLGLDDGFVGLERSG